MAVLESEDPARPWESIPSESGLSLSSSPSSLPPALYNTPIVSESSLIQLAINALQGMESALITIEKLCTAFDSDPTDRTFLRIPSIWKRTSSTLALGRILKSIGCSGCLVFLLRKFVDHFENLHFNTSLSCNNLTSIVPVEDHNDSEPKAHNHSPQSLVNHAFSVALRKLLEGCIAAVDTLYASVNLRRSSETVDTSPYSSFRVGCLARSDYSEVTLLEVYLHTKELTTEIDVIGNICQVRDIAFCFSELCLEDLVSKAKSGFLDFPRGGDLLTYLYSRLKVADPVHTALLKFLFLRSCEPYCEFIRSWIYKAEICDPYKEFMVEYSKKLPQFSHHEDGSSPCISLAAIKERDGVAVPCFLKDMCIPIFRAGQQLQVLMKLFELSGHINNESVTYGDILPCWSVFSSDHSSDASPLSFDRESVEALSHARSIYYKRMMTKMDIILEDLRTRFQQVVSHGTVGQPRNLYFKGYSGGSQEVIFSSQNDDKCISPTIDKRDVELIVDTSNSEASSTNDELPYIDDQLASSECSSSDGSEQQNECQQFHQSSRGYEQKVLCPLELLSNTRNKNSFQVACATDTFNSREGDSSKMIEIINADEIPLCPCLGETKLSGDYSSHESRNPDLSWFSETQCKSNVYDKGFLFSGLVKNPFSAAKMVRHDATSFPSEAGLKLRGSNIQVFSESSPFLSNTSPTECSSTIESNDNDQFPMRTGPSSSFLNLPNLSSKCHSNPLSMNPVLFKTELLRKREKGLCADQIDHAPSFDFSSVKDPCKVQEESFPPSPRYHIRVEKTIQKDPNAYAAIGSTKFHKDDCDDDQETLQEKNEFSHFSLSLLSGINMEEDSNMANVCGGSSWESMLNCLGSTVENSASVRWKSLAAGFEMPLDFVIEKCLLQEILHQYWYISKLTIKILEDGFKLREHLSALRRYHFMELADWADLFIVSLWNRKWEAMEVDRTVSEIQGLLAISLQKSSCEKDDCKDRLFVYIKGIENNMMPSLIPKIEIDSFNFLGLGYKVDWPISIVLTPGALEIYVQIFSFLLRVKLAIFSLTDTWCLMKDLLNSNHQSLYAKARKLEIQGPRLEMQHLNALTTVRHQVNHFVTTLQQYVQSQLSHVSSCRYTDSLNSKVKDMMDLQSVHMAYLIDSLHICFLSDEMKVVASIIQNILQCALNLRSCLIGSKGGIQTEGFPDKISWIDISQVLAVKNAFKKNITDLRLCFLKAPKQREFSLAHFWGFLNYNEYYSDFTENGKYNGFPI